MHKTSFYIINAITVYRGVASFLLLYLAIQENILLFKWLLAVSFATDAIDGFLARKYHVVSVLGARLDSMADDLTILIAIIGIVIFKTDFIWNQFLIISILLSLYVFQLLLALVRYRKPTSFHTYLAKASMILQGVFFILLFFLPKPPLALFYIAAFVTTLDILEEILLVLLLPKWEANIKGWLWLKQKRKLELQKAHTTMMDHKL